jgi:hypothetical protein
MDPIYDIEDPFLSVVVVRLNELIDMANMEDKIPINDYFTGMTGLADIVECVPKLMRSGLKIDKDEYRKIGEALSPLLASLGARVNDYTEDEIQDYEMEIVYEHLAACGFNREKADKEVEAILRNGKYLRGEIPDINVSTTRNVWNKLGKK